MEIRFDNMMIALTPRMVAVHGLTWRMGGMTRLKVTDAREPENARRDRQGLQENLNAEVLKPFQ